MTSTTALVDAAPAGRPCGADEVLEAELRRVGREITRLEATRARLIAQAERSGLPQRKGFGSTTGWLIALSGDPHGVCRSRAHTARALVHMPRAQEAFTRGALSEPRVRLLALTREVDPDAFTRDEDLLVSQAGSLPAAEFGIALAYWRRLADTEGHLRDHERAHRYRHLHASTTWAGTVRVDGHLDPEGGATLLAALRSLTDPTNLDPHDERTPTQRRADALVEIARRHLDSTDRPAVGGQKPHLNLTVDVASLRGDPTGTCELDTGPIPPTVARRIACDATLTPILTRHGTPIAAGRATRIIPPALRRAVAARDRHCTHPGCTIPTAWCDAHHIIHWADGGPTTLDNLRLLCRRHHRLNHQPDRPDHAWASAPPRQRE